MNKRPDTIFVIDTPDYVMMVRSVVKGLKYAAYRFDNEYAQMHRAAQYLARLGGKQVMDMVDYDETDPLIYHPQGESKRADAEYPMDERLRQIIA